jgi:hypothetical protein
MANAPANSQGSTKIKIAELEGQLAGKQQELKNMRDMYDFDMVNPGKLWIRSPIDGVVLTPDFRDKTGMPLKESQPIIRIGGYEPEAAKNKAGDWEIELKIQQRYVGHVLTAFSHLPPGGELDVDILLASEATRTYKGKLARNKISAEATPNKDDNNESEPVTLAWVRISGKDIPKDYQLEPKDLVAGLDVRTRIRCGNHRMGYSLFYGVFEFLYEKVIFFF